MTIQTVGTIQAGSEILARTTVPGMVDRIGVETGDRVAEGDILILLDLDMLEQRLEEAERQLEEAEFILQSAENRVDDDPSTQNQFELLAALNDRDAALRAVEEAEEALQDAAVTSPESGIVSQVLVQSGDIVSESQIVARLFSREELHLIANVDELDLANVQPGAEVQFRLDAYPATELSGQVNRTAPVAEQQGGATVFDTEIAIEGEPDVDIRPGMNADVTIVTDQRENVLLIPESAIRTVGERSFVEILVNGDTQDREVILGYRSGGQAEVVSGLEEGDEIITG